MATRKCPSPIPSCSSLVGPSPTPRPSYPFREVPQLDAVLDRLSQAVVQEGHRLKAWGVLGSGTGAKLLQPGEPQPGPHPTPPTPPPSTPPPHPRRRNLALYAVPPLRHLQGRKGGGRLNKWKPPRLGGASCAASWANRLRYRRGGFRNGKSRGGNKQNHHKV